MIATHFQNILDTLNADATLTGYLGGSYVLRASLAKPARDPSVTIRLAAEKCAPRVGYNTTQKRIAQSTIQVDVWVSQDAESFPCCGEDADLIESRIDHLLVGGHITGTHGWQKTSSSQQHEPDVRLIHNVMRYQFEYLITDT